MKCVHYALKKKNQNAGCDGLVCDKWIIPIIAPSHSIKLYIVASLILLLVCDNGRRTLQSQ